MIEGAGVHPEPANGLGPGPRNGMAHELAPRAASGPWHGQPEESQLAGTGLAEIELDETHVRTIG